MRNKHDGAGYRRVAVLENNVDVFCGWCLIVQVASRMPVRGVLRDDDGSLDAADLAAKTGYPERVFTAAFEALTHPKIQWLEVADATSALPANHVSATSALPLEVPFPGKKGVEGNRTEVVATTTTSGASPTPLPDGTAYPTLEQAKEYAASQAQRLIKPEWVEKWWLDRDRKGWTFDTRSGNQRPIENWRSDLQFYAQTWKISEDKEATKAREKERKAAEKAAAKNKPNGSESSHHPRVVTELPPTGMENPFPAMFAETAERRRKHEEWLATPHGEDEVSPYL